MGSDYWYRNVEWNEEIESSYRAKLSRSRSMRPQYLTTQASLLAQRYPEVALRLIAEYFETKDRFHVSQAYCINAEAQLSLGEVSKAVQSYKLALAREREHPNVLSTARYDLPVLVATQGLISEYEYAQEILTSRFKPMDHQLPSSRYYWNGANAIIAQDQGHSVEAREFAERALRAATATESPFRYHPKVGLVRATDDEFGRRLKRIARPSKLNSLLRIFVRQ